MNSPSPSAFREDRHPSESYEDILARDTRGAPDHLRQTPRWDAGVDAVPCSRFYDPAEFQREVDHLWPKVWQWACREEDIPNVGDYQLYDNVGRSLIVVRTAPNEIRAFHNSCLHRGRKLVTAQGCRQEFRCPFHGMAWALDGSFKENPIAWDFPQWKDEAMTLPQARVAIWGGFVFVNLDRDALPLEHYIAPLAEHFERYNYADRYTAVHISKVVKANWKVAAEAFMESHHSVTTHPQILINLADVNSQYDMLSDYVSRQFSAVAVPSPMLSPRPTEEQIAEFMTSGPGRRSRQPLAEGETFELPPGMTARAYLGEQTRKGMQAATGRDFSEVSDAEVLDALLYNLFPHMSFWAGYGPVLVYRWRPFGMNPDKSIMDILILSPVPASGRPPPAPVRHLGEEDSFKAVETLLGGAAQVFEQDMGNLPYVQEGLRASETGVVHYGRYSEGRIRHMHHMIQRYLAGDAPT